MRRKYNLLPNVLVRLFKRFSPRHAFLYQFKARHNGMAVVEMVYVNVYPERAQARARRRGRAPSLREPFFANQP
jgi:hypothetical protein